MSTDGVCFIPKGWITMVWPLSWEDDNWQSRFHTLGKMLRQLLSSHDNGQSMVIYPSSMKYALSVDIVSWQRSEHGYISLKYEICSVSWHRLMTTVRAWLYIPQVWNMLRQLSSSHDNRRSMVIHFLGMKHAPSVVIVPWQQSDHGDSPHVWNTLCQLPSSNDNDQSMVMYSSGKKHAPSVVIVPRKRSEHGYISLR